MTYKYDVFISYSRKDYKDEATKAEIPGNPITAITEAFDKNNISYWIDRDGIYSGQEFENIIIDAIDSSKVFLFVSSANSNESKWTKSEIWEAFEEDKNIIPFKIENIDYHKSLKFKLRPLDFIDYFSDKEGAIQDLVRSVNMYKEELAKEEKKQLEAKLKAEITEKIRTLEEDFKISVQRHEVTLKEILELHARLGTTTKICPICDKKVPLETAFCERCGWQFPALLSSDVDKKRLTLLKTNWRIINSASTSKEEIKALRNEIYDLNEALKKAESEKQNYENTFSELKKEIDQLRNSKEKVLAESKEQKEHIALLTTQIKNLDLKLAEKGADYDSTIKEMQKENEELNAHISTLKAQNEELTKKYAELSVQYTDATQELNNLRATANTSQKTKQNPLIAKLTDIDWVYTHIIPSSRKDRNNNLKSQIRLSDSVTKIDLQRLITIVREYGVILNESAFKYCKNVSDIVSVVVYSAKSALESDNEKKTKVTTADQEETLETKQKPSFFWSIIAESYLKTRSSNGKHFMEIGKDWVFNNIMPLCKNKNTIYLSDKRTDINFTKLVSLLKDYGLVLDRSSFDLCNTVEDVVDTIVILSQGKLEIKSK